MIGQNCPFSFCFSFLVEESYDCYGHILIVFERDALTCMQLTEYDYSYVKKLKKKI